MSKGIYKYTDLETNEIVYVGKDSHIDRNDRHKAHMRPSRYDDQQINRILQNNPYRYEYSVIWATEDCTTLKLNKMEILFGKIFNPKFNFGKFGSGGNIKLSDDHKRKLSENHSRYWKGKTFSDEHKRKIGEAHKGMTHSDESKILMSESKNTTGYFRVTKMESKKYNQGFFWRYGYYKDGKKKYIQSASLEKLEKKVKNKGLAWGEL